MEYITLRGALRVAYLNGRFGQFPVGTLDTAIGTFAVRDSKEDAWLETLDAGEYDGEFSIAELSLYTYKAFGEARTCIRAVVADYRLDGYDQDSACDNGYPDPLEEEGADVPETFSREADDWEGMDDHIALLTSFDTSWTLGADYRIDSTIGRANIIACRKALDALGYVINPLTQYWYLAGEEGDA